MMEVSSFIKNRGGSKEEAAVSLIRSLVDLAEMLGKDQERDAGREPMTSEKLTRMGAPWSWHKLLHEASGKIVMRSGRVTVADLDVMMKHIGMILFEMGILRDKMKGDTR